MKSLVKAAVTLATSLHASIRLKSGSTNGLNIIISPRVLKNAWLPRSSAWFASILDYEPFWVVKGVFDLEQYAL